MIEEPHGMAFLHGPSPGPPVIGLPPASLDRALADLKPTVAACAAPRPVIVAKWQEPPAAEPAGKPASGIAALVRRLLNSVAAGSGPGRALAAHAPRAGLTPPAASG